MQYIMREGPVPAEGKSIGGTEADFEDWTKSATIVTPTLGNANHDLKDPEIELRGR